jgi:hypothetical protein
MAPRAEVPVASAINDLDCQTIPNTRTDVKRLSGALANQPFDHPRLPREGRAAKESPRLPATSLGSKTSADRHSKKRSPNRRGKPLERRHLAVCLGRGDVGYIDQVGRAYTAKALDGQSLGAFADLRSAADAVSAAALQAQPVDAQVRHSKPRNSADGRTCGVEPPGPISH